MKNQSIAKTEHWSSHRTFQQQTVPVPLLLATHIFQKTRLSSINREPLVSVHDFAILHDNNAILHDNNSLPHTQAAQQAAHHHACTSEHHSCWHVLALCLPHRQCQGPESTLLKLSVTWAATHQFIIETMTQSRACEPRETCKCEAAR